MNDTQQTAIDAASDAAIAALASKTTWAGSITAIAGAFTSSGFGIGIGAVVAISSLLINWYYKAKQDRREQREHEKRMSS